MAGISKTNKPDHKFTYIGVEKEENFGLNWMETSWRGYDVQLGRFHGVDKKAEDMIGINPYHYSFNNPIRLNDPTGLKPSDIVYQDENGKEFLRIKDGKKEDKIIKVNLSSQLEKLKLKRKDIKSVVVSNEQYKKLQKKNSDVWGLGINISATVGAGMNLGFEWVFFNKGDYKGQYQAYFAIGANIGLEASLGAYYFEANFDGKDSGITPDSWLGGFNSWSYGIGFYGQSTFWGNADGTPEIEPGIADSKTGARSRPVWKGKASSGGIGPPKVQIGFKWSFTNYSYASPKIRSNSQRSRLLRYRSNKRNMIRFHNSHRRLLNSKRKPSDKLIYPTYNRRNKKVK